MGRGQRESERVCVCRGRVGEGRGSPEQVGGWVEEGIGSGGERVSASLSACVLRGWGAAFTGAAGAPASRPRRRRGGQEDASVRARVCTCA